MLQEALKHGEIYSQSFSLDTVLPDVVNEQWMTNVCGWFWGMITSEYVF